MKRILTVSIFTAASGLGATSATQALDDMPTITLDAEEGELLRTTVRRALDALDPGGKTFGYLPAPYDERPFDTVPVPAGVGSSEPYPWRASSVWLYFGLTANNELYVDNRLFFKLTVGDLFRSIEQGHMPNGWRHFVVYSPVGRGGGSPSWDILEFLGAMGITPADFVVPALPYAISKLSKLAKDRAAIRAARAAAESWVERGLDSPWILRNWLDRQPEWTVEQVATNLKIPSAAAKELLRAVGFEQRRLSPIWVPAVSKKGKARRARWLAAEMDGKTGLDYGKPQT